MSRPRTTGPQALVPWVVALAAIAGAVAIVGVVRAAAPLPSPPDGLEVPEGKAPGRDVLNCERVIIITPGEPIGRLSSGVAVECPDRFDGQIVTYVGEVVGDVLRRSDGAWVLMNDDPYALEQGPLDVTEQYAGSNSGLSVWLPGAMADLPDRAGNARWRGDVLHVTGVMLRSDPEDGGGLTIRATEARVVSEEIPIEDPVNVLQALVAVGLLGLAGALAWWVRIRDERR